MAKIKISEFAAEVGLQNKEALEKAQQFGLNIKTVSSNIDEKDAGKLAEAILSGNFEEAIEKQQAKKLHVSKPKQSVKSAKKTFVKEKLPIDKSASKTEHQTKKQSIEIQPVAKKEVKKALTTPKNRTTKTVPQSKIQQPITQDAITKEMHASSKTAVPQAQGESFKIVSKSKLGSLRTGGFNIKKKKRLTEDKFQQSSVSLGIKNNYGKLSAAALEELNNKKGEKKRKPKATGKKDSGQVLEIASASSLADISSSIYESQDVLLDLNDLGGVGDSLVEEARAVPKKDNKSTGQKKSQSQRRGRQSLVKRSVRKKRRTFKEATVIEAVSVSEEVRVYEFAEKIGKTSGEIIGVLFKLGELVTKNDFLDKDKLEILGEEFGIEVTITDATEEFNYLDDYESKYAQEKDIRAPVVTIMGHVDHGKTSLLDKIRNSKIVHSEAGGITQHIGAYSVMQNGKMITFIDTPGHAAFTQMRARGASVTDIVVIVVAADDGVKPQTKEALSHAKTASVPIIIVVNKIDKSDANVDLVKSQMAEEGYTPLDWGGEYEFVEVSAHTKVGIDTLLETILLQAEILELKANANAPAKATVVESSLEKGRGPVATVIVNNGNLSAGDIVVCGKTYGRVRSIIDASKESIKNIGLSQTAVVVGLNEVPDAGDILVSVENEKIARELAQKKAEYDRLKELSHSTKATLEDLGTLIAEGNLKSLKVVLKTDVAGTLEAIKANLNELRNEEVKIDVVHGAVGGITESDVILANSSENCVILGFNVRPTGNVREKAKQLGVDVRTYSVIYDMIDDMKAILSGIMSKVTLEENTGQAQVREVFHVSKVGTIAGCLVSDGKVTRGGKARLIRDGVVLHVTTIGTLKRFKDDVKEVQKGYECGITLHNFNDIKVGDFVETFIEIQETQKL